MTDRENARDMFGRKAAYYTTSATHSDKQVLEAVVRLAQPQPTWRALDIGTGTGHTALALAPHLAQVIGLDLTPEMLAEAETLRQARGLGNVSWQLGDAHALPFADGAVELVSCRRAAHHFTDIRAALSEMVRVLAPGGRLVIDDRSGPEDDALDALMNRLDLYHDRSHVRQYRPSAWAAMLEEVGLTVEAVEPYVQHRAISALTDGATPEDVALVHATLEALSEGERAGLRLEMVEGQQRSSHWYVLVAAIK
jgi:ubiquinone/menaquinone biosynthesis C-methylase UbiE